LFSQAPSFLFLVNYPLLRFLFLCAAKEKETKRNAVFCQSLRGQKNGSTLLRNSLLGCALVFCPMLADMGLFI
jgi:hypothetical protein